MNKKILILAAAAAVTLTACGPKEQGDEAASEPSPAQSEMVRVTPDTVPTQAPPAETPEAAPEVTAQVTQEPQATEAALPPEESAESLPPAESGAPAEVDPLSTPEVSASRGVGVPTDEEVLARYREADEALSWFVICTLPGDAEDVKMVGDIPYTRVKDDRFPTMDSLRAYLKTLFSDEIVDSLLPCDGQQYMDIDGALYVSEGARGADTSKGGVTLMVVWPEGNGNMSCTVRATVELLDWPEAAEEPVVTGEQIYEFPYQKVGDKWVFTRIESIF